MVLDGCVCDNGGMFLDGCDGSGLSHAFVLMQQ